MPAAIVSVVMGVYNGARYLRPAVQSVLEQTFGDFEFIIINDASTDATERILHEFADPRMRILTNLRNQGLTRCLIRGCNEASGKYIARMDADDISCPERFEKQVAFLEANPDHSVVGSCCYYIDESGNAFRGLIYPSKHEEILRVMETFNPLVHGAVMFRVDIFRQAGGYREIFQFAQDYDLWLRLSEKTRLSNLPDFLYQHRIHYGKIAIKRIYSQHLFVELARRFAEIRKTSGTDPLMKEDYSEADNLLEELSPNGLLAKRILTSQYFADLATDLFQGGLSLKYLNRLLFQSFINNPFNKKLWALLLSFEFKQRIRSAFKNKLFA